MRLNKFTAILWLSLITIISFTIQFVSVVYLNYKEVYIFEQGLHSYYNNSIFMYLPFFVTFMLIFFIILISPKRKILKGIEVYFYKKTSNSKLDRILINIFTYIAILALVLYYVNIILSGNIPILNQGYISRFDYLETTRLWFILKVFGKVGLFIPVVLGYSFFYKKYIMNTSAQKEVFLFFMYLIYLILIGHKFGGLFQSLYLFLTPTFIYLSLMRYKLTKKFLLKFLASFIIVIVILINLVYYHYSKYKFIYTIVDNPFEFILYRLFALQGHVFWGVIRLLEESKIDYSIENIYYGMKNLMILLGDKNIYDAIERGVNFTSGYPAVLLISFPMYVSILINLLIIISYLIFINFLIKNLWNFSFIPLLYLNVIIYTFFSIGSLEILLSKKTILLILILFGYYLLKRVLKYGGKNIHYNSNLQC